MAATLAITAPSSARKTTGPGWSCACARSRVRRASNSIASHHAIAVRVADAPVEGAVEIVAVRDHGAIAQGLGSASAVRAVGAAVERNPISVIGPYHRVVSTGGALTGYAGGLERKVALLELENAQRKMIV
ncbi:MAG: Methylated-DNA--protein-cysteine methyltransferase [Xylophilus sp.]|nr:MAG: Methylated-DNA--protein-cysteine methyltransferase [Xylophilus sp.]